MLPNRHICISIGSKRITLPKPMINTKRLLPNVPKKNRNTQYTIQRGAYMEDLAETVAYYAGKMTIMFTMFYCTLNWMFYKSLQIEENDNRKK